MKKSHFIFISFVVLIFVTSLKIEAQNNRNKKNLKVGLKKGNIAPEIELYTPEGDTIKLSSLRGSIVYIDFWASWCKGCRIISKYLDPIYQKYKDQKFINGNKFYIYTVSLDTSKDRWLKTIVDDSLHRFINVSDLKGFDSKTAKDYKIGGLPVGYLIDGDGIIIDTLANLRPALEKILLKEH